MFRTVAFVTSCALAAVLAPSGAGAQSGPSIPQAHVLGGHTFVVTKEIRDPFIATRVRTLTGMGVALRVRTELEDPVLEDRIQELVGDLGFMTLEFEFQLAATDWLVVGVGASGAARTGTNGPSVLSTGISTMFSFEVGALARLLRTERWLVSGTARVQPVRQYRLDLIEFARRVVAEGEVAPDNVPVARSDGTGVALGAAGSFAATPWLGLTAAAEIGYADALARAEGGLAWDVGASASFDLDPLVSFPVGILAFVKQDAFVVENSDLTNEVRAYGWGLAYTGRDDFSVSLETSHRRVPLITGDQVITAHVTSLNLRYYF